MQFMRIALVIGGLGSAVVTNAAAQSALRLDSLVAHALAANPGIRAAGERVQAARARVRPAGTMPDPMGGLGIMNFPITAPGYDDMTMNALSVGQTVPYPGKLGLQRRAAEREVVAADSELEAARRSVIRDVKQAYYELSFLDRSLDVLRLNQEVLAGLMGVSESRYAVGTGAQHDILKAQVETSRLSEEAVAVVEERRAVLARLNALLDRSSDSPVAEPQIPQPIQRAAVSASTTGIRFTSTALGARAADSPVPAVATLQERAVNNNAELRAHEAMIAAQTLRLELARKAHLPDFDVSLQYGQRPKRPDLVSLMVSVPLPVHRKDQQVAEERATLAALQAEHHVLVNELRSEIAGLHAQLERSRAQLALFVTAIIPQGRAAVESALASFQVGRVEFLSVLESRAILYGYETAYHRALTDFAQKLAELEGMVGQEILP